MILSAEKFEPKEEIYYKRHIAVDIPSVYGRYSERKFDALGLTFRLESLANVYLEKLFATVNLNFITQATFIRILGNTLSLIFSIGAVLGATAGSRSTPPTPCRSL